MSATSAGAMKALVGGHDQRTQSGPIANTSGQKNFTTPARGRFAPSYAKGAFSCWLASRFSRLDKVDDQLARLHLNLRNVSVDEVSVLNRLCGR